MKTVYEVISEHNSKHTEKNLITGNGKKYKKVIVYTHSGQREIFENVSNLIEDKKNEIIEFDAMGIRLNDVEGYQKLHIKLNPGCLEYSEEII